MIPDNKKMSNRVIKHFLSLKDDLMASCVVILDFVLSEMYEISENTLEYN